MSSDNNSDFTPVTRAPPPDHPLLQHAVEALQRSIPAVLVPRGHWIHLPAWIMASVQYIGQLRLEIRTHEAAATMSKNQVDRLEYQMSQQTDRIHKLAAVIEEQKTEAEKLNSMNVKQTARVIKLKQRLRELGVDPDTIE